MINDKNSLFGGGNIGGFALCVKEKGITIYGGFVFCCCAEGYEVVDSF
jgi:hypothetical protein